MSADGTGIALLGTQERDQPTERVRVWACCGHLYEPLRERRGGSAEGDLALADSHTRTPSMAGARWLGSTFPVQ